MKGACVMETNKEFMAGMLEGIEEGKATYAEHKEAQTLLAEAAEVLEAAVGADYNTEKAKSTMAWMLVSLLGKSQTPVGGIIVVVPPPERSSTGLAPGKEEMLN